MATFLDGVRDLALECNASPPSSVVSQVGEHGLFVKWFRDAYTDIQNRKEWRWLTHAFTINTVDGSGSYRYSECIDAEAGVAITRFSKWLLADDNDPPKIYLQSSGAAGERWLIWLPWDQFKQIYKIGSQNNGSPVHISVDHLDQIHLGPIPNGTYVVTGNYIMSAQTLSENSHIPEMPPQFHSLIVYRAMEKYGYYESAQEVILRAQREGKRVMRQLEIDQSPKFYASRPMV